MSRSEKYDDESDDMPLMYEDVADFDGFPDAVTEQSIAERRRVRRYQTKKRLEELEEARWLRRQTSDWDTDRFQ